MRRFFHAPGRVWPTMSLLPWMQISHHWAGALIMLAALTAFLNLRRNGARFVAYLFGCALAPAAVLGYLLEQHTLFAAFDDVILYPATITHPSTTCGSVLMWHAESSPQIRFHSF